MSKPVMTVTKKKPPWDHKMRGTHPANKKLLTGREGEKKQMHPLELRIPVLGYQERNPTWSCSWSASRVSVLCFWRYFSTRHGCWECLYGSDTISFPSTQPSLALDLHLHYFIIGEAALWHDRPNTCTNDCFIIAEKIIRDQKQTNIRLAHGLVDVFHLQSIRCVKDQTRETTKGAERLCEGVF